MTKFYISDLLTAAPEIFLFSLVCVILIVDLFFSDKSRHITGVLVNIALITTVILILLIQSSEVRYAFSDMYIADPLSDTLKVLSCSFVLCTLIYSKIYISLRTIYRGEFFSLTLFSVLGMMIMISANHFLILYLGLELLSLSLYSLVALSRGSLGSSEAAVKYFILGALASGLLLYGMSMLYGATGSLFISGVAESLSGKTANMNIALFGLVFIVAGIAFKVGAVPFHMWVPDVYQGAPTAVTLLIATAPKFAAFAFIFRLLVEGMGEGRMMIEWRQMLLLLGVMSIGLGNLVAIAQTNIKRMLAYSTMAHMGFVLLGFSTGLTSGIAASMFYVSTYVLAALGAFGMILFLSRRGFESDDINDFKGLSRTSPWLAFTMLLIMFSMAGIPPTIGFWAKLSILQGVVETGFVGVAVFAVIMSLVGAFYYLRIIKLMFFDELGNNKVVNENNGPTLLLSLNGGAMLALGLLPGLLLAFFERIIKLSL